MVLEEFSIKKFKNLKDITINFDSNNVLTMLIGNNGSGKSNILEAISAVFHDAYMPSYIRKLVNYKCEYSLKYQLDDKKLEIKRKNGILRFRVNGIQKARADFIRDNMPKNIIGVYSGEENRLWLSYYKPFFESYIRNIKNNSNSSPMKLTYIDKEYWNISLLTLLVSQNETLQPFINEELGIHSVEKIVLKFNIHKYNTSSNELLKSFIDRINEPHDDEKEYSKDKLSELIFEDFLITADGERIMTADEKYLKVGSGISDFECFNQLVQAHLSDKEKIITDIEIVFNGNLTTATLSEGEKKLILIKTIFEIISDEKSLLLLDEPDAHLHEGRKKALYKMMMEYPNRQAIIATHSPTFIDIAEKEQIKFIKSDENGNAYIYDQEKIEAIRELTGSRFNAFLEKPVLYCEGNEASVEKILYPILFPNYKVIPTGGHEEVINFTKAYNKTFGDETHYAIGIIDSDYKTTEHLAALREEKIYSLNVVEIENVLMDITLLEAAKSSLYSDEDCVEKSISKLIEDCDKNKQTQALKYTTSRIVSEIKSTISSQGRTLDIFKQNISQICDLQKIDETYNERLAHLSQLVQTKDFERIVSIYDFHHNIDGFLRPIVDRYQDRILRLINEKEDLQNYLKNKYYSDIPNK